MKTRTQILADRVFWGPVAAIVNLFARKGKLRSLPEDYLPQCIAVCKFKGMGSIVQATPLLAALRTQFPGCKIVFVSTESNRAVLSLLEGVDEILCVKEGTWKELLSGLRAARKRLRQLQPDVYIDLEIHARFSGVFALRSGAPLRFGFQLPGAAKRSGLYSRQLHFDPDKPMSEMYFAFAKWLGCQQPEGKLHTFSRLTASAPFELPPGAKLYVLNPNASDGRLERRWPAEKFAELGKRILAGNPDAVIALTGSGAEQEYVSSIASRMEDTRVHMLAGQLNLEQLIRLLKSSACFVTNDTGPMHLAFAADVTCVALFGPVAPWKYHIPPNVKAIYQGAPCSPCLHRHLLPSCGGDNICMKKISVEEVYRLAVG